MERPLFTARPLAGDKAIIVNNECLAAKLEVGARVVVIWDPFLDDGTADMASLHVPVLLQDTAEGLDINPQDDVSKSKLLSIFLEQGTYARWEKYGEHLPPEIMPLLD